MGKNPFQLFKLKIFINAYKIMLQIQCQKINFEMHEILAYNM